MTSHSSQTPQDDPSHVDPTSDQEERRVFFAAIDSFRSQVVRRGYERRCVKPKDEGGTAHRIVTIYSQYRKAAHYNITHLRRQSFYALPATHIDLLSEPPFALPQVFDAVDDAIDANANIAEAIVAAGLPAFGFGDEEAGYDDKTAGGSTPPHSRAKPSDMDKARSTIRQLYRDWSEEAASERRASFKPIFDALMTDLPHVPPSHRHIFRLLVPGAGLGRLVLELVAAGYTVEGNEISYHQLLASNYLLNGTIAAHQHSLYPWALGFSNHHSRKDQLRRITIPDVHPGYTLERAMTETGSEVDYSERMSMSAGDFCSLYRRPDQADSFSAVVTCFFVDTAPNVIRYVETVRHCLRDRGLWVNLGPLLWHFESAPTPADRAKQSGQSNANDAKHDHDSSDHDGIGEPGSFELSDDEVIALLERFDFEVIRRSRARKIATGYIQDPRSMLQNLYQPSFWVARRKGPR